MTTPVIDGDRLRIHFADFGPAAYDVFLRAKRIPEFTIDYHEADETYTFSAPTRFAPMLGVALPGAGAGDLPLSDYLFDDQRAIVRMALAAKRFACWADCGLGKTPIALEFARHVIHRKHGRVLLITLNEVVNQFVDECRRFYGDSLSVVRLTSRQQMRDWCAGKFPDLPAFGITNYEKMNPDRGQVENQVVNEMRHLAGIILDESNRLAMGGGKQKWAIIKSCRGIEYKLSCTATPAPNDTMEFASQASFLEKMRSEGEIIWTYFVRDSKTHRWCVKRHAREAFFEFMAAWSIAVRDPRRYGWRKDFPEIPEPVVTIHEIEPTPEQTAERMRLVTDMAGQMELFPTSDTNVIQRGKLSQLAKGFYYAKVGALSVEDTGRAAGRQVVRVPSRKPSIVADLIRREVADGLQVLVWTVFDAESTILAEELRRIPIVDFRLLTGKTPEHERLSILEFFRRGELPVLVSRASMLGYGLNLQNCGSMIFSGFNDSYVAWYQAIRRAYRYGQTKTLRVHMPVIRDLEADMLENIGRKDDRHLREAEEMEKEYIKAREVIEGRA